MHKPAALLLVLAIFWSTFLVMVVPVKADTITVPDLYPTISAAIDNANNGDTIFVRAGTYNESLIIDVSITLVGDSPNTTVVNGPFIYNSTTNSSLTSSVAILVAASNVRILSVSVNNGIGIGIVVNAGSDHIEIADSVLNCGTGVSVFGSYSLVDGNVISGYSTAVLCAGEYCNVTNNDVVLSPGFGIYVAGTHNFVSANNVTDPNGEGYGIFISNSSNTIQGNTVFEKSTAISVMAGLYNGIIGNSVTNCSEGMGVDTGFNNTFTENTVTGCGNGASVGFGAYNNTFFFNDFIGNTQQVFVQQSNINHWDNGTEGNYWLDYTDRYPNAVEVDDSGVWNVPYVIDANNVDNFPLMSPFEASIVESTSYPLWLLAAILVAVAAFVMVLILTYFKKL